MCTHELWEMDSACADGMCPLCLKERCTQLREALEAALKLIDADD